MKHLYVLLVVLIASTVQGQMTFEKIKLIHPSYASNEIELSISPSAILELEEAQKNSIDKHEMYPTGKLINVEYDFMSKANWSISDKGERIGKLVIFSNEATSLGAYFKDFYLPIGAKLYAYNQNKTRVIGPFSFADNLVEGEFSSGSIKGNRYVLELVLPQTVQSLPNLIINKIGFQRDPKDLNSSRDFGDSQDCQVNVECSEADNWSDQRNSVVRILLEVNGFLGWCSGTIMNNTYQDCTPYILTADHCRHGDGGVTATESEYNNWEFYFLYESDRCRNPNNESDVTISKMTGCTKLSSSTNAADGDSDFLLVKLKSNIQSFNKPFYAGWDRRNTAPTSGVMMHHPAGDIKKISTYTRQAESSEWDANLVKDSHWKVYWTSTSNGFGVSEGGSSGSAIWNQNGRVVGQLTGGSSACKDGQGVGPFNPDYFGKMSYNWIWGGSDSTKNLEYWLDNGRSNLTYIDGINWPCSEGPLNSEELSVLTEGLKLFPNPSNGNVTISVSDESFSQSTLKIFNSIGKLVLFSSLESEKTIDCSDWPKGIYFVNCENKNSTFTEKLIIK
ncbi:MAG: T9SS type A sorting domain-containing protein [Salibacteraceae bacterium]